VQPYAAMSALNLLGHPAIKPLNKKTFLEIAAVAHNLNG
jgi:hypothetical protein